MKDLTYYAVGSQTQQSTWKFSADHRFEDIKDVKMFL